MDSHNNTVQLEKNLLNGKNTELVIITNMDQTDLENIQIEEKSPQQQSKEYTLNTEDQIQQERQELIDNEDEQTQQKKWYDRFKIKLTPKQQLAWMIFKILIAIALMFTGAYLFLVSLEKTCPEDKYPFKSQCVELLNSKINQWLKLLPIITLCLLSVTILGFFKFFDKYRIFMGLGLIEIIVLCFCIYSLDLSKSNERNFASAQALCLVAFVAVFTVIFFVFVLMYWIFKKQKIVFAVIIATMLGLSIWAIVEMAVSCKHWEEGLTGKLDYGQPYCKVNSPSVCWPDFLGSALDFSPSSCQIKSKKYPELKEKILTLYGLLKNKNSDEKKQFIKDSNYLAWPLTVNFAESERLFDTMQQNLLSKTQVVSSIEEGFSQKKSEVVIDLKQMQLNVNVVRNADLVNQRMKQATSTSPIADTVIVIYIDTLSRAQTHRKLKKSMKYMKQFATEGKDKQAFEFYRYHSIDKQTLNNNFKLHFDHVYSEVYENIDKFKNQPKQPNLMHDLKQNGHVVAHASNTCTAQCSFREENLSIQKYFLEEAADHEFLAYDPTYINPENYFDSTQGPASMKRRCIYNKDTAAFIFDYGLKFLEQYKDDRKALYLEFTDSHEITSEVVKYMDDYMENFFKKADEKGLINKSTTIYIMSDHGQHLLPTFYMNEKKATSDMWKQAAKKPNKSYTSDVYKLERMLPVFQMLVSNDILEKYTDIKGNLTKNQQIIFGMGDVRNTLIIATRGRTTDSNKYDYNLFSPLKAENDCRDIGMIKEINQEQFCVCRPRHY